MNPSTLDIDAWTIPPFSSIDGIEGLYIDDERLLVDVWSYRHAERVNQRLPIARSRVQVAEWQIADAAPHGVAARTAKAEAFLAEAQEELRELEYRRDMLEASRVRENGPEWRWA
ncbi:MAG: hypothetical protein V4617_01645 [Gemmatimonadota bacterium]